MFKNNSLKLLIITILTLLISGGLFWQGIKWDKIPSLNNSVTDQTDITDKTVLGEQNSIKSPISGESAKVTKVVDGDTIEIDMDGKRYSVRLIGIDTPETVDPRRPVGCFGKEASNETKGLLTGKEIILEKDLSNTDKYSRLLRYVYLSIGEGKYLFVNDYLVRQGFAKSYTYPPDVKYQERFVEAEKEAREKNLGLWGKCK